MAKDVSIEIGFTGGASTAVAVPDDMLEQLTGAVTGGGGGWMTVTSSDGGEFLVDTASVVFLRVGSRNRSIGFAQA